MTGLLPPGVRRSLAESLGIGEGEAERVVLEAVSDVADMIRRFVWAERYTFADRLAYAASREVVSVTLYEALRESESAFRAGRTLDENVKPYTAKRESVDLLLRLIDLDPVTGLEVVRRVAILAMARVEAKREGGAG
ncbi:MAG: hypothetical protein QXU72_08405 [Thermofilum sp.]